MTWTIDSAAEHFWLGFGVGVFVSAWLVLVFFMWQRMPFSTYKKADGRIMVRLWPPSSAARTRRDLEKQKARGRVRLAEARKLLDEYEEEFGEITEQEMLEIIEEAP